MGIADQHPADGYGRFAVVVPDGGVGSQFQRANGTVIPGHWRGVPEQVGVVKALLEGGLT